MYIFRKELSRRSDLSIFATPEKFSSERPSLVHSPSLKIPLQLDHTQNQKRFYQTEFNFLLDLVYLIHVIPVDI